MPQHRVGSVILLCLSLVWGARSLGAQSPAPRGEGGPLNWPPSAHTVAGNGAPLSWCRAEAEQAARNPSADAVAGELRIVDSHRYNFITIVSNVCEPLMELDKDGTLVPRLAAAWRWYDDRTLEVHLRQGVKFHNGEVFDAAIVQLNWEENLRLRQPHRSGDYWNFKPGSRLEVIDAHTVRFVFPEPDGGAMARLALMHIGNLTETWVTEQHWSARKQKSAGQE